MGDSGALQEITRVMSPTRVTAARTRTGRLSYALQCHARGCDKQCESGRPCDSLMKEASSARWRWCADLLRRGAGAGRRTIRREGGRERGWVAEAVLLQSGGEAWGGCSYRRVTFSSTSLHSTQTTCSTHRGPQRRGCDCCYGKPKIDKRPFIRLL